MFAAGAPSGVGATARCLNHLRGRIVKWWETRGGRNPQPSWQRSARCEKPVHAPP